MVIQCCQASPRLNCKGKKSVEKQVTNTTFTPIISVTCLKQDSVQTNIPLNGHIKIR